MPKKLFNNLLESKNFQSGLQTLRQVEFALFDIKLHTEYSPKNRNFMRILNNVRAQVSVINTPPWNKFPHSFSHIFSGGYASAYYSYKWAEVLSADAYSLFEEIGILSKTAGNKFKKEILSKGGSRSAWNVNSLKVRLPQVLDWINLNQPDVLCLQETKQNNDNFPHDVFEQQGLFSSHNGQNTYNGVAIISNKELINVQFDIPNFHDEQKRLISGIYPNDEGPNLRIISAYIPNGQSLNSDKFEYKKKWLKSFINFLQKKIDGIENIITGDFNIAPSKLDCYDSKSWDGKILVSPQEREYFDKLLKLGFIDTFREMNPNANEFSWWDYRIPFKRNLGMRIDHILLSKTLLPFLKKAYIDKATRTLERPSDHVPVVTELSLNP
jgi:exodeoxyribonuclease-3